MERYLGVDVRRDSSTVCVLDAAGKQVRRDVVETNGKVLVGDLRQLRGARVHRRRHMERVGLRDPVAARGGARRLPGPVDSRFQERLSRSGSDSSLDPMLVPALERGAGRR